MFKSREGKAWSNFEKEVLAIPSNEFVAKALLRPVNSISPQRKKGGYPKSGKYKLTDKNFKVFLPKLVEICIKNNSTANFPIVDTIEKIERLKNSQVSTSYKPSNKNGKRLRQMWTEDEKKRLMDTGRNKAVAERHKLFSILAIEWNRSEIALDKQFSILSILERILNSNKTPVLIKIPSEKKVKTDSEFLKEGTNLSIGGTNIFLKGIFLKDGDLLKFENGKLVRNQTL